MRRRRRPMLPHGGRARAPSSWPQTRSGWGSTRATAASSSTMMFHRAARPFIRSLAGLAGTGIGASRSSCIVRETCAVGSQMFSKPRVRRDAFWKLPTSVLTRDAVSASTCSLSSAGAFLEPPGAGTRGRERRGSERERDGERGQSRRFNPLEETPPPRCGTTVQRRRGEARSITALPPAQPPRHC